MDNLVEDWKTLAGLAETHFDKDWIFRGAEDELYALIPRVGRSETGMDLRTGQSRLYSGEEADLCLVRLKREARPHMPIQPQSDLEWLSIAQHHGPPTRLLDWTMRPLVAAYFALKAGGFVNGRDPKDAAIYGVECPLVVEEKLPDSSEEVVAYFPQHLTPRIAAQQGLATYHKNPQRPYSPPGMMKWTVPSKMCFTLKVILNKCGYNEASMFPDLDGVARHVGWLLKWRML